MSFQNQVRYQERPERYEDRLTEKGIGLCPAIVSPHTWGDRWMAGDEGPPVRLRHETRGDTITAELSRPDCGEAIDPRRMTPSVREVAVTGSPVRGTEEGPR